MRIVKTELTKESESETTVVFRESDGFKWTYYKTREAANKAGRENCEDWGSNLVYLGCSPVTVNGEEFFETAFNVWD